MPKYKYGYGLCPSCGRASACTKDGSAYRHGPRDGVCPGTAKHVIKRRFPKRITTDFTEWWDIIR